MDKVSENPFKNRKIDNWPFVSVTALFITSYLVSNIMAVKVVGLFNLFYFDAGTITFPFAYMLGDVLTEIWGFRTAKRVIFLTFACNILMVICTHIGVHLPSPDYLDSMAVAYNTIFAYVPRIVLASLAGFLLGELSNAWLMEKMRKITGKHLWVRTIGSSMVGYIFDTVPFVLIAFAGILTVRDILLMIALQYVMKIAIEACIGTPLAYAAVAAIRRTYILHNK